MLITNMRSVFAACCFLALPTPAAAGIGGSNSSSMAVAVEVVRPAVIDYGLKRGSAAVRIGNAEARVTTSLRPVRDQENRRFAKLASGGSETIFVTVEY